MIMYAIGYDVRNSGFEMFKRSHIELLRKIKL